MKATLVSEVVGQPEDESGIVSYLEAHPEFFSRYPDLLQEMTIDHSCNGAASLIEHQVSVLRTRNHKLSSQMSLLIENARSNEVLGNLLHRLTMDLMDCRTLEQVLNLLYAALQDDFEAEYLSIMINGMPICPEDIGLAELLPIDQVGTDIQNDIKRSGRPLCGRLNARYRQHLFGDLSEEVQSAIVLSLGVMEPFGLLAIGNPDAGHFQPAMSTLFLRQLADIAERAIRQHVVDTP